MGRRSRTYILSFACMALAGCADNSYRGFYDVDDTDSIMPIAVRIMIGSSDDITGAGPAERPQAKGAGVVDEASQLSGRDIYVYAFNSEMNTSMSVTSAEDENRCLIDGSLDRPGTLAGKRARLSDISNVIEWQDDDGQIFWPDGNRSRQIYSLFAYYVDDIPLTEENFIRMDDAVAVEVEIDGNQDLMSSKAEMTNEQKALFKDDKELADMMYYCYSYYAAQNGINPVIVFKHHLVKLDFAIQPGCTIGHSSRVTVKSLEIMSRHKALFTVADKANPSNVGLQFADSYKAMPLEEEGGGPLAGDYTVVTYPSRDQAPVNARMRLGGSLIVAPDSEYTAYITLSETREDGSVIADRVTELVLATGKGFEAGNRYNATLTICGAGDIEMSVHLKEWYEGGDIFVDDEEKPSI